MKQLGFSIRDAKSESWSPPMWMRSRGEAIRSFADEVNSGGETSMIARHPEDFTLFYVGEFDVLTGELKNGVQPESLGCGSNFVRALGPEVVR